MKKTAVIGATGFIGGHLLHSYRKNFEDCIGTGFSIIKPGLTHFDLRKPNLSRLGLEESGHEAVIIASAKSKIDYCGKEKEKSYEINVKGTLDLVRQIAKTSMQIIFFSSDYVFSGENGKYIDSSERKPSTEYGLQKMQVEDEIPKITDNYLILRLGKGYGIEKNDGTILDEIACSIASGYKVLAAWDQIFCPTYIEDLISAIHAIQTLRLRGFMNLCNESSWSRYDIALAIANSMGKKPDYIQRISLSDLSFIENNRPRNTSMKCNRFNKKVKMNFTRLQDSISIVAKNWI